LHFKYFCDFLVLLRKPILSPQLDIDKEILKQLKALELKICVTCWQIVCESDNACSHPLTDTFTKMEIADRNKFISLAKQSNMTLQGTKKGSELKVRLMTFSEPVQARFERFGQFRTGKLEFLFSSFRPGPQVDIPEVEPTNEKVLPKKKAPTKPAEQAVLS